MVRKVLFGGNLSSENRQLRDMSARDWASMVPLSLLIILLGVYPRVLLDKMGGTLDNYWQAQKPKAAVSAPAVQPVPGQRTSTSVATPKKRKET
jgi:NADH-quinone oxidoreductase subunit M